MGGFSASGATVVIFIGALIGAAAFLPVAENVWEDTSDAYSTQHERQLMLDNTNFTVNSEWDSPPGNSGQDGTYQVYINNTGTTTLDVGAIDYQLDGELREPDVTRIGSNEERTFVRPGETLITEFSLSEEPDRLQVTVETGQSRMVVQ